MRVLRLLRLSRKPSLVQLLPGTCRLRDRRARPWRKAAKPEKPASTPASTPTQPAIFRDADSGKYEVRHGQF